MVHWNGSSWATIPAPPGGGSLKAFAPNDIYAAGGSVWHFDGSSWSTVQTFPTLTSASFAAIDGVALSALGRRGTVGDRAGRALRRAAGFGLLGQEAARWLPSGQHSRIDRRLVSQTRFGSERRSQRSLAHASDAGRHARAQLLGRVGGAGLDVGLRHPDRRRGSRGRARRIARGPGLDPPRFSTANLERGSSISAHAAFIPAVPQLAGVQVFARERWSTSRRPT